MFSKSSSNPEAQVFTFISHWQKCVDCNDFYFDYKDVLSLVIMI